MHANTLGVGLGNGKINIRSNMTIQCDQEIEPQKLNVVVVKKEQRKLV